MDKLLYELDKLSKVDPKVSPFAEANTAKYNTGITVPAEPVPEIIKNDNPEPVFRTYDDRRTRRSDLPAELQTVYDEIAYDSKLRRGLHEKMKMATTDKDRAEFRSKLMETEERIRAGWNTIDTYLKKKAEESQKGDDFNASTCRSYISKALAREKNSPIQINTVKARIRALQEHGCAIEQKTLDALKAKGSL